MTGNIICLLYTSGNTNSPQTGDSSNVAVYALLALAAAGMMGVTLVARKRRSDEV